MNILIAGGGSAGHINPALSIAKKIKNNHPGYKILFIGSEKGLEKDLVPREGFDIEFIEIEGFKRPFGLRSIKTLFVLIKGLFQAGKIIKRFKPDIAIGTGGFVSGPAIYISSLYKAKILIHEQNAYPGITNRMLARRADVAMVSFESALKSLSKAKKTVLTGNLIDESFSDFDKYQPADGMKTVVIIGGSQGAMTINNAVTGMINEYMKETDFKLIFAPGKRHYEEVTGKITKTLKNVTVHDYIYDRNTVYASADLMVTRGGATTISEVLAMGMPSIIIPSPFVPDNAQEKNAEQIYEANACEIIYDNSEFNSKVLYDKIMNLLGDKEKLIALSENAYSLGIRDANQRVYEEFSEVVNEINRSGK
ncbi:MAG TPA: undecaprenyldiphospho-muramoylpentapeptide beta-N-acetylglucosaminyltransferase [Clostridia bacterium]|jgi:UDP-N-acetylglucosamine--N-acetylmuramyl-(pentapeptide) pyrophosphoryl-undecaprenol N-acetylglucosamine transferase|nr:undecaprenyldiphospho-muramoylpentapeptide beta-N-acetylglucosaminyltransferase [Clostridiaceae bacterium]HOF26967.1 undecaprenyldiphospho-muramoylpentapeptide beta-N-acetylglucosaminyltransferase [Clostridia bacterium]HOR90344.1 undecaprenyldiphospho-muramoylpentapeptide beta-N-acetylglucosaminyltransferase [Clostridia bacterium]HOT70161.1 undecaprenyldiphospho-muramoylpentapeptide beta-N-acetylglucosaminyltransferase [Clostridia bacterium]HPL08539.1 undecaprenyldiphospho-muramoylpentapepti